MKIIVVRMQGYSFVSTPLDAVSRELENLGHTICIAETVDDIPADYLKYDFVFSAYESVTLIGDQVAQKTGLPHVAHIEWLAPWRIFKDCDIANFGLKPKDPELTRLNQTIPYYKEVGKAWVRADIKTISSEIRIPIHEDFLGDLGDVQIRYPSVDVVSATKARQMYTPKRKHNNIITVSRAVSSMRYDLLVQVMNQVQTECTWTIIGDGPYTDNIMIDLTNTKVSLNLIGAQWGWVKFYELLCSTLFIGPYTSITPMEAALMGVPPILIEGQSTTRIPDNDKLHKLSFGDALPIFEYNETSQMATLIDKSLNGKVDILTEYDTVVKFLGGKTKVTPSSVNAQSIITRFEQWKTNETVANT